MTPLPRYKFRRPDLCGESADINLAEVVAAVLGVWMLGVVSLDEITDAMAQFFGGVILVDVNILALQASEPPLNDDVVDPSYLAVHALTNLMLFQKAGICSASKLATLVRINNCGSTICGNCFGGSVNNRCCINTTNA